MPERQRGWRSWKASKGFENSIEVSNREAEDALQEADIAGAHTVRNFGLEWPIDN